MKSTEKYDLDMKGVFSSPDLYFWKFTNTDSFFLDMDRDAYQWSIFFDHRISPTSQNITKIELSQLIEASKARVARPPDISYIFHMAHCGSTLLARALDIKSANIVYREPTTLRQLGVIVARSCFGGTPPESWRQLFDLTSSLLGKTYNKSGPVIIKGNVPVNFIISQLMDVSPQTRGVLLYATLDDYLLSVLKSPTHRDWVKRVLGRLSNAVEAVVGVNKEEREEMSSAQAAACLWLVQISIYARMADQYSNIRTLDAENFYNHPRVVISNVSGFFGFELDAETIDGIVNSDLFSRHSKVPRLQYDNIRRVRERENLRTELEIELAEAKNWVEDHSGACSIPAKLPSSLTGESAVLM